LNRADLVIGPSPDGGYWLIGQRARPPIRRLFDDVRWSSPHTLADTLVNAKGYRVAHLPSRADIDTGRDLARARKAGLLKPVR
jgi:glycosyltransferase A (GT-A) superfamily protein (DUF2064 family)